MRFSLLSTSSVSRLGTDVFAGYNHNLKIGNGEFYHMENISADRYPVFSPRGKRGNFSFPSIGEHRVDGMIAKDSLCYVDKGNLYIDNYRIDGFSLTEGKKQLVSMGAYLLIYPDKKYINTKDYTDKGSIEADFTTTSDVSFTMCRQDGEDYGSIVISTTPPENPDNMALWIDSSSTPHILKQYSQASSMWVQIPTVYVKIAAPNIARDFELYDGVKISGIDPTQTQLKDLEGQTSILWAVHKTDDGAGDYIVVVGILDVAFTQTTPLRLERKMPNVDFVIESQNRLWGCRYGTSIDGEIVNEIYSSKLGDFKNWNSFMGLSTDSYVASCGTDGEFTGAVSHLGYPLFFKENCLHKVYGQFPSNFQVQTTPCRGVMKGAGESLAIVNEILYYKSRNGVCAYDGSLPTEISAAFGDIHYSAIDENGADPLRCGAVGGTYGNKYLISMKSEADGNWNLFVFDKNTNLWHREDDLRADSFCFANNNMFFVKHSDGLIYVMDDPNSDEEVSWYAETGDLMADVPERKYVGRTSVRISIPPGESASLYIKYEGDTDWTLVKQIVGVSEQKAYSFDVRPRRCDHFRMKIAGTGDGVRVYSITRNIETGGDYR